MKEKILEKLRSSNDFISGSLIAEELKVSRMAVSKNIKKLIAEGFDIKAVKNKGYLLVNEKDVIDPDYIKDNISDFYADIRYFDEIGSTNDYLKSNSHLKSGSLIISDSQSSGRGRFTRTFYSPRNKGVYLSLLLKPEMTEINPVKLTSLTAVAINSAIKKIYPVDSKIKWVNDIMIDKRKICGILIEASMELNTASLEYLVIGFGINVHKQDFPEDIRDIATSIENECDIRIPRNKLIVEILNNLEILLKDQDNPEHLQTYITDSAIINKKVRYSYNKDEGIGTVVKIDDNASLHLLNEKNEEIIMSSGEIEII